MGKKEEKLHKGLVGVSAGKGVGAYANLLQYFCTCLFTNSRKFINIIATSGNKQA